MNPKQEKKISKYLSLVLRHKPEVIGLKLDSSGWADVKDLISKMKEKGFQLNFDDLKYIVDNNNKSRFAFNDDKSKIRANQGHSLKIDLGYKEKTPPEILYHGTSVKYLNIIYKEGLKKMNRHHVHLSKDIETANAVGKRHGKPVIFKINTKDMLSDGHIFYESENGVWLTDNVPAKHLNEIEE